MRKSFKLFSIFVINSILLCSLIIYCKINKVFASATTSSNSCELTIDDAFKDDSIIVTLDENLSRFRGIDPIVYNQLNTLDIADIQDLTEMPSSYINKEGRINRNCPPQLAEHFEKISFKQILLLKLAQSDKQHVLDTIKKVENITGVLSACPNMILEPQISKPTDLNQLSLQWGLIGENGIHADEAWTITTGDRKIRVGVIDSGVATHPALMGNVANGYDFYNKNYTVTDDPIGHGTAVAGVIGALGANGGLSGIAKQVTIVPLQVTYFDEKENRWLMNQAAIIDAIRYARDLWGTDKQISVLNYSISGFYFDTEPLDMIEQYPGLFVWSAGNDEFNLDGFATSFPRAIPNIISVGAINRRGNRWSSSTDGSNYGSSVDIFAPGAEINSTYPLELSSNGFSEWTGTSFAAPHVTGVAALMLSKKPELTGAQLKPLILAAADTITIDTSAGKQSVRKLNAYKAVKYVDDSDSSHLVLLNTSKDTIKEKTDNRFLWLKNGEPWPSKIDVPTAPFGYEFPGYYYHSIGSPNMRYQIYTEKGVFNNNNYYFTQSNFDAKEDITLGSYWKPKDFLFCVGYKHFAEDYRSRTFLTPTINYEGSYAYHMDDKNTVNGKEGNFRCWEMTIGNSGEPIEFSTNTMLEFTVKELIDTYVPNYTEYEGQNIYFYAIYDDPPHCIADGSMITLADGTQKAVEELDGSESLLVWNMLTGQYDTATVLFIDSDPLDWYEVINLYFSDGTNVKVISEHAFWDFDLNEYVFLRDDADKYIGHWFNKQSGGGSAWERVQLTDVQITTEYTAAWSPVTSGYLCYYVDGMLSMPGATEGLINIFEVDGETMTYNSESFARDIETYGLFTYDEFAQEYPVSEEIFNAFNGQYLKVALGKGIITCEQLENLIDRYSCYFA